MSTLGNNLFASYYAQQGLPYGYRRVEYLESTGTQYVDLGIVGTQNTRCELIIKATQINTKIFGARTSTSKNNISVFYGTSGDPRLGIDFNNSNYATYRCQSDALNQKVIVTLDKSNRSIKNTEGTTLISNDTFCPDVIQTPTTLRLFDVANGFQNNCFIGDVYACKIVESLALIRNFIPCVRLSDNKPGLYDLCGSVCPLTNTPFYVNTGRGEFVIPT